MNSREELMINELGKNTLQQLKVQPSNMSRFLSFPEVRKSNYQ